MTEKTDKAEKSETGKLIDLVRKHAVYGKSHEARRLLRTAGGMPRRFKKIVPTPDSVK